MGDIMWQRPKVVPVSNPPCFSTSSILRDPQSRIWATYGPNESPKTSKDTLATVAFSLVWFWMVKSRWLLPLFIPLPIPPHESTTQYPWNPKSHKWGLLVPHQRLETT